MQWDFPLRAPVLSMMAGRRRNETVCESLFCTIAVITPVVVAIVVYRKDVRELLKILFFIFLVLGACLTFRHTFFRLIYRVRTFLRRRRPQVYEARPDLDEQKQHSRMRAQEKHDSKAEDHEIRIAGPRREEKLKQLQQKMDFIHGFKGEGHVLGRQEISDSNTPSSLDSGACVDEGNRSDSDGESDGNTGQEIQLDEVTESQNGKIIRLALKLPERVIKRQFLTTDKIKLLYDWIKTLNYSSEDYCITTLIPKQLLLDQHKTLEEYGLVTDTMLVIEERE